MSLEGWSKEQIEECEQRLLAHVPVDDPIGNVKLRAQLTEYGWSEDLYWELRNRLIARGVLAIGRGKGGSVRRVSAEVAPASTATSGTVAPAILNVESAAETEYGAERDLYLPLIQTIKDKWAQDYRLDALIAEVTAVQGSRQTRGRWTRPDLTVASMRTFPYVPGRHFDILTFEVKPVDAVDVTVVYEALGHRRASTKAYALIHVPESARASLDTTIEEICQEAKRFGVGVVIVGDPGNYDTWEEAVEPVRHEPDPERLNEFLSQQVSQGFREQIVKWLK